MTLQKYAPTQDVILPDEMVVFIRGVLHAPPNDVAFIDCNQTFAVSPGDPTTDGYQD